MGFLKGSAKVAGGIALFVITCEAISIMCGKMAYRLDHTDYEGA